VKNGDEEEEEKEKKYIEEEKNKCVINTLQGTEEENKYSARDRGGEEMDRGIPK